MGVQSQSALIAALLLLGLAINVYFERRRVEHRTAFTLLLGAFALFNLTWFIHSVADSILWLRLLALSSIGVAQACLLFFDRAFPGSMEIARTPTHAGSILAGGLFLTDWVTEPLVLATGGCLALGVYGFAVWRLYERYQRAETQTEATRLGYLVWGGVLAVVFSGADVLISLDFPAPALGHLWNAVYMYFWMQVIQRSRLLDLKEIMGRGLALTILSFFIAILYFSLLVWVEQDPKLFVFNIFAASVVLFFVFDPLRRIVDLWVGRLLFRETHELEESLKRLTRQLSHIIAPNEMVDLVLETLKGSRRVTQASVFLLEGGGHGYQPPNATALDGSVSIDRVDSIRGRAFLDVLHRERFLSLEHLNRELRDQDGTQGASPQQSHMEHLIDIMHSLSSSHSFAVTAGERLLGFLNVRDDRSPEAFSTYEIGLFAGLTNAMATVVENSELVHRVRERDRLSALGEMATGMAHEIRNPLGAIKSAAQLLNSTEDEESETFLKVIVDETNRLDLVLRQFLDFARPFRGALAPMHVKPVLERVATLVRAEQRPVEIAVEVHIQPDLPEVVGDEGQVLQVCLNVARNACQAMEAEGGVLVIAAMLVNEDMPGRPGRMRQRVEIRMSDSGPGMDEEVQKNLFIPFFTTKQTGTGLGLPISQRLLQHHGTDLRVDSGLGKGTVMSFRLILARDAAHLTGEYQRISVERGT